MTAITLVAGCGGSVDGKTDTVRPTIVSTVPAADATSVSVNTTVTVTFSEEIDPATVTATSVVIGGVTAEVVGLGATARLTPQAALELDTTYTATATTGVADLAGNTLAESYSWSFSTGATVENVAVLTWEAPTTNEDATPLTDLAGYTIYSGTTSRGSGGFTAYDDAADVGLSPICAIGGSGNMECTHVMQGFTSGTTVYFAVTAYDTGSNESDFSNEASKSF